MDKQWMGNNWSKAALEMALFDAAAKTVRRPLVDLIGRKTRESFPLVGGIGTDSPDNMAMAAQEYVNRGFKTVKLKIGELGQKSMDVERVRTVREEVGSDLHSQTNS